MAWSAYHKTAGVVHMDDQRQQALHRANTQAAAKRTVKEMFQHLMAPAARGHGQTGGQFPSGATREQKWSSHGAARPLRLAPFAEDI